MRNDVVKKTEYNELVKKVHDISSIDTSNLGKKTDYNTKLVKLQIKLLLLILNISLLKNLIN